MNRQTLLLITFAALLFLCGCGDGSRQPPKQTGTAVGENAIDFTLYNLEGGQVTLSSFKGEKVVCLVFWATWCPGCLADIPDLKNLHSLYADKGLKILAVNIGVNDSIDRVLSFQKRYNTNYPILFDSDSGVARRYGVSGIPATFIIDKDGVITYRGITLPQNAETVVKKLL